MNMIGSITPRHGPVPRFVPQDRFSILSQVAVSSEGYVAVVSAVPSRGNLLARHRYGERRTLPTWHEAATACASMAAEMRRRLEGGTFKVAVRQFPLGEIPTFLQR